MAVIVNIICRYNYI